MAEIVGRRKVIYHKKGHMTCTTILTLHVRHVFKGNGFKKKRCLAMAGKRVVRGGPGRKKRDHVLVITVGQSGQPYFSFTYGLDLGEHGLSRRLNFGSVLHTILISEHVRTYDEEMSFDPKDDLNNFLIYLYALCPIHFAKSQFQDYQNICITLHPCPLSNLFSSKH